MGRIELLERTDDLPVRPLVVAREGLTDEARQVADKEHALVLDLETVARLHGERFPRLGPPGSR